MINEFTKCLEEKAFLHVSGDTVIYIGVGYDSKGVNCILLEIAQDRSCHSFLLQNQQKPEKWCEKGTWEPNGNLTPTFSKRTVSEFLDWDLPSLLDCMARWWSTQWLWQACPHQGSTDTACNTRVTTGLLEVKLP